MHAKVTLKGCASTEALKLTFTVIFPEDVDSEEVSYTLTFPLDSSTTVDDEGLGRKMAVHGIAFYRSADSNRLELFSAVYELRFIEQGHEIGAQRFTVERRDNNIIVEGSQL